MLVVENKEEYGVLYSWIVVKIFEFFLYKEIVIY